MRKFSNRKYDCDRRQGNVVMLTRCDGEEEDEGEDEGPERLLKGLTHQCSLTLHVQGLPTGFCRDIHGQVCAFPHRFVPSLISYGYTFD